MLRRRCIKTRQDVKVLARHKSAKEMRLRLIYHLDDADKVTIRVESYDSDSGIWILKHLRMVSSSLLESFDLLEEAETYHVRLYRHETVRDHVCVELRRSPGDIPDHTIINLSAKKLRRFTRRAGKLANRARRSESRLGPIDIKSSDQNPPS